MDSTQQKTFTGFIIAGLVIGLLAWRAYYGTWPVSWPGAFGTVSAHYAYSVCSSQALGGAFNYLRACQWSYTWHTRCEIAGIIAVILLVIGIAGHVRVARRAVRQTW